MNSQQYHQQVALLIRIMPSVYRIKEFAVHGGTAINLFHQDMPRYSVDIDLTYIPIAPRSESLADINSLLQGLKERKISSPSRPASVATMMRSQRSKQERIIASCFLAAGSSL